MAAQHLAARYKKRRKGLTRPDKRKQPFPDLVRRDYTAPAPDRKWCGDITEIPTDEGKLYLATTLDLFSRRLLGYATSARPDAELAGQAIKIAVATRGGNVTGVIFHSDRGSIGDLHSRRLHCPVPETEYHPVHGTRRILFRQCCRGIVFLNPGMGGPVASPLCHPRASRAGSHTLVLRFPQQNQTAQFL